MDTALDIPAMLADFGQAVTVDGASVRAIFDAAYAAGSVGAAGMAGVGPVLTLKTADVPASPVGKAAVVGATNYVVAEHQPDGTGVSLLLLEAA